MQLVTLFISPFHRAYFEVLDPCLQPHHTHFLQLSKRFYYINCIIFLFCHASAFFFFCSTTVWTKQSGSCSVYNAHETGKREAKRTCKLKVKELHKHKTNLQDFIPSLVYFFFCEFIWVFKKTLSLKHKQHTVTETQKRFKIFVKGHRKVV